MVNEIRAPEAVVLAGPVALLLDCHQHIRHFAGMAVRLAENPTAAATEICGAAEAIVCFFTVAFPLHEADENESISPRLRHAAPAGDIVVKSVETMVSQHGAIDELLQSILPLWQAVQSQPVELIELAPELKKLTNRLRLHLSAHLAMEEDVIFPALEKLLPATERQALEREMRARQSPESR
jgi:iron-sulfur cluster repair protein YtfE (RIC family)